MVVKEFRRYV